MRGLKSILFPGLGLVLLAGCSFVEPEPIASQDIIDQAVADQALIARSQEPVEAPLDLANATARALKFNLDHRVQIMEEALANESFELAKFDMLPVIAAEAGITARDEFNASRSTSLLTRQQSLEPSYSEDRTSRTASVRFSWSILDFGISYLQARQESNRYLIATLAREKAMRQMVQQVRTAYWRAAGLQQVSGEVDRLLGEAGRARADLERVRAERLRSPVDVLEEIRGLTEIIQQLEAMQQSVSAAMIDLCALINAPIDRKLPLDVPDRLEPMPAPAQDLDQLELVALANSADYTAQLYNVRVDRDEAHKSLLRLLPGVELFASVNYDANSHLYYNHWKEIGSRVTWNVMRLASAPQLMDQNEVREMVTQARRLAANMGTITQLHLTWREYGNAVERLHRAADIDNLDREINQLSDQANQSRAISESLRLRNEVRALRSTVARVLAYAAAQEAYGDFLNAAGLTPAPADYQARSVAELAGFIRESYDRWLEGRYPEVAASAPSDGEVTEKGSDDPGETDPDAGTDLVSRIGRALFGS